ncbi:MAG: HDIG domain-containing protein [Synergistaceae bacterium]|jgi:putative nucleotidyltransferase with HDIG domain|nr:HDIG domain-containing protein [Synergistaceae bacterium]
MKAKNSIKTGGTKGSRFSAFVAVMRGLLRYYFPLVAALWAVCAVLLVLQWRFSSDGYRVGEPSPRTYYARSRMEIIDNAATNQLRDMAAASVAGVVVKDGGAEERMRRGLDEFRDLLDGRVESARIKSAEQIGPSAGQRRFDADMVVAFRGLSDDRREALLDMADKVGEEWLDADAKSGAARAARVTDGIGEAGKVRLWDEIGKQNLSTAEANLLYQLLSIVLEPSYRIDPRLTDIARDDLRESVSTVERTLRTGDVIVERGQDVTFSMASTLQAQGYSPQDFPWIRFAAAFAIIAAIPLWLEILAGTRTHPKPENGEVASLGPPPLYGISRSALDDTDRKCIVTMMSIGWVCELAATYCGTMGAGILASAAVAYLCMPRRFAYFFCIAVGMSEIFIVTRMDSSNMLLQLFLVFASAMMGYGILHRVGSIESLSRKVLLMAVMLAVLDQIADVYQGWGITWETLMLSGAIGDTWREGAKFLFAEAVLALAAIVVMHMLENFIGVMSAIRTMELSHPSNPLLRKLQTEAPGTYHHSLMIGTLAEAVAPELGLDPNVMKVGAYYHDIGKLRRPNFFIENQRGGVNVHDSMTPTLSAMTIIAHVREGLDMAREFHLPRRVRRFIGEHHGTTTLGYFYKKAKNMGENVDIGQFRYPGPKPRSRETALLMILDSSEAAMRAESGSIRSLKDIREVVERVIAAKLAENQFDDVDFTFSEMTIIKEALFKAFQSMYHTRVVKEIK